MPQTAASVGERDRKNMYAFSAAHRMTPSTSQRGSESTVTPSSAPAKSRPAVIASGEAENGKAARRAVGPGPGLALQALRALQRVASRSLPLGRSAPPGLRRLMSAAIVQLISRSRSQAQRRKRPARSIYRPWSMTPGQVRA